MNVYGLIEEDRETFVTFQMDIFVNLQKIPFIFQEQIFYETRFCDLFESIRNSLTGFDIYMNECDEHHFVYINDKGEEEQLFQEEWNQPVKDIDIFRLEKSSSSSDVLSLNGLFHTLKLEQTLGCLDINHYKLEKMIGIKKDKMVNVIPDDELLLFEESIKRLCVEASGSFAAMSLEERLLVEHPIKMNNVRTHYNGDINIRVFPSLVDTRSTRNRHQNSSNPIKTILVNANDPISVVIDKILLKFSDCVDPMRSRDYLLKIADREEYLVSLEQTEIIKFQYINLCVQLKIKPDLILVPRRPLEESNILIKPGRISKMHNLRVTNQNINENEFKPSSMKKDTYVYIHDLWKQYKKSNFPDNNIDLSSYEVNSVDRVLIELLEEYEHTDLLYTVKISSIEFPVSYSLARDQKVVVAASLYHGEKTLCEHQYREWNSDLDGCEVVFPIEIWNLPRMARLSFGLAVVKQSLAVKELSNSSQKKYIGWGNVMVYNHNSVMQCKEFVYRLWPNVRPNLNPTGSVYSNPDGDLITPIMTVQLLPKLSKFRSIVYPPIEILIPEAGNMLENDLTLKPSPGEIAKIEDILAMTSIDDIMADEQNILWKYRYYIRAYYQESLPKILNSRPWNNFETIAKMQHLARGWPIDREILMALQLLGSDVPDCDIRMMAVDSLSRINWEEFSLYLLQICQCLKYESYLNSNMIQMLLRRMISNAKIAQSMFYYMRVEISSCEWCKVPFSTFLYYYLQYFPTRCASLLKQIRATNEINQLSKALMIYSSLEGERKSQILEKFRATLSSSSNKDVFDDLTCPLDCNIQLKTLRPNVSKFMDSKMRPIRLSWIVSPEFSRDYMIIYKNGDDLRQDALIVQMMHIMDSIWQRAGLDLKLYPYDVLACSKIDGYIQVVQKAETLANISKSFKDKNSNMLCQWLKQRNPGTDLKVAVKNFTSSCGAYCVATFILGIGDRHSDNIMIREDGHFFHIDYGHILGNIKKIIGGMVPREWTKFILVDNFLRVIAEGDVQKEQDFKNLCCRGYLALRSYSNLFLILFKSMINAGIPEISGLDDLTYLKNALQIGKSDDEAQIYFQNVYDDTRKKEMFVSLNWFAHEKRRNNN